MPSDLKIIRIKVSVQVCRYQCLIYSSMFSAHVYGLWFQLWEIFQSELQNSLLDEQPNIDGGQSTTLLDFSLSFQFYSFCFHLPLPKLSQVCRPGNHWPYGTRSGPGIPWCYSVFSALFLIVVLSALIIASINTIRETKCGKKCLPGFLLSWKWLPLACRSLEPYDKFCSCSCCGKQVR